MAKFKKGDQVKQIVEKPIAGVVVAFNLDSDGNIQYHVDAGDESPRVFNEDQIEADTDAEGEEK